MTPAPRTHEPAGGDGLMFIITMAIVAVVIVEGLFIAYSSWWLMSVMLVLVVVAAIGVCAALVRLIDHDTPLARPQRRPEPAPEPAPARAAPAPRRPTGRDDRGVPDRARAQHRLRSDRQARRASA